MIIRYFSDLHTEFYDYYQSSIKSLPYPDDGDILIFAGDLGSFRNGNYNKKCIEYLNKLTDKFSYIFICPGNHEYYDSSYDDIPIGITKLRNFNNVFIVKEYEVIIDNVRILFTSLFPDLTKLMVASWKLNDFNSIRKDGHLIHIDDYVDIHKSSIELIKNYIDKLDDTYKNIIVSHFVPINNEIRKSINRVFDNNLDPYFYNEIRLEGVNLDKVNYWIYGHNHSNIPDIKFENTIFTCNQVGYMNEGVARYDINKFIET